MFSFIKNLFKKDEIEIIKEPKITFHDGCFASINHTTILIKYKNKLITYPELKYYIFKYLDLPNSPKLILDLVENKNCKIGLPLENRNRFKDFKYVLEFIGKYDIKVYFKDWIKQVEHPEIKNVAWFLAEKGFLYKKKEKNRVYYKFKQDIDYDVLFKELFEAKNKEIEFWTNRIVELLADKNLEFIKIETSCFDRNLIGVYKKLDVPIYKGCTYINIYSFKEKLSFNKNYPTLKDVLNEIIKNK